MAHCDAPAVPAYTYKEEPHITLVVVEAGSDAADDWIAARAGTGDVVITADVPLADRTLKTGAQALDPAGRPFTSANIGSALASRRIGEHLRAMGEVIPTRVKADSFQGFQNG